MTDESAAAKTKVAMDRIRTYVDVQRSHNLGDIAFSEDFRTEGWPRSAYALLRSDMLLLLEHMDRQEEHVAALSGSLERLHSVVRAVLEQAGEWAALAPPDDWGAGPHDAVLSDVGRAIQRIIKDAYKEGSHD